MKVVVLCGPPGSGKTTFCEKYPSYIRISQDDLGSRHMCLSLYRKSLAEGRNIIVDRCNITKLQRNLWISLAKDKGVTEIDCISLVIDPELAIKRVSERKGHPSITEDFSLEKIKDIVYYFHKAYEPPELTDGFDKVLFINVK